MTKKERAEKIKEIFYNNELFCFAGEYFDEEDITEAKVLLHSLETATKQIDDFDDDNIYIEIQNIADHNEKLAFQVLVLKKLEDLNSFIKDISVQNVPDFIYKDKGHYMQAAQIIKNYNFSFTDALHMCIEEATDFNEFKNIYRMYDNETLYKFWYRNHKEIFFEKDGQDVVAIINLMSGSETHRIENPQDEDDVWEVVNEKYPYDFDNISKAERELHKIFE